PSAPTRRPASARSAPSGVDRTPPAKIGSSLPAPPEVSLTVRRPGPSTFLEGGLVPRATLTEGTVSSEREPCFVKGGVPWPSLTGGPGSRSSSFSSSLLLLL